MRKPRYTGCNCYIQSKNCWKENHIPFVGFLYSQHKSMIGVFLEIITRYAKLRGGFLFPQEVEKITLLFKEKHPELASYSVTGNTYCWGGVHVNEDGGIQRMFGLLGLFSGRVLDDRDLLLKKMHKKHNGNRDAIFLELSSIELGEIQNDKHRANTW